MIALNICWSCKSEVDPPISHDPALLIGKWDCIKFAYTEDGKNISDVAYSLKGRLLIQPPPDHCSMCDHDLGDLRVSLGGCVNSIEYNCSLSDNLINFRCCLTTNVLVTTPHEEYDLKFALHCAYSFDIKGNELFIYFKGDDESLKDYFIVKEDKNILILKKSKK